VIGRIVGTLVEKTPPSLLVDAGGVGFEIDVPMSTFYDLPAVGQQVALLTHFVVREDAQQLFGFQSAAERAAFRALIRISGVGPRTALAVLSGLSVDDLAMAVGRQDGARLTRVPGIGKKTAERLLLELKGKLAPDFGAPAGVPPHADHADIAQALLALGYNERDAQAALKVLPPVIGVAEGIKVALRALVR
jgi:Holliday junction DNA helicase RuvA